MRRILIAAALALTACDVAVEPQTRPVPPAGAQQVAGMSPAAGRSAFAAVTRRVEPVAERECRARTENLNCDFLIRIDPDPNQPPNAYQSLDKNGRPVITFTQSMLGQIANQDELAFVMSHEAAHHIRGHLYRDQQNSVVGAVVLGGLVALGGGSPSDVATAQDLGAFVGARSYSKGFELEADELGTIITHKSGYSPRTGVQFFYRLPDPGDQFLGTHPANPDRIRVVQNTIDRYNLN